MELPEKSYLWPSKPAARRLSSYQVRFLTDLNADGHDAFTNAMGLVGAVKGKRSISLIYRGGSKYWELFLEEDTVTLKAVIVNDMSSATNASKMWLRGRVLEDALKEVERYIVEQPYGLTKGATASDDDR